MSRASNVRDCLVESLQTQLGTCQPVHRFLVPRFKREQLTSGPRVVVRIGNRDLRWEQGPDTTDVLLEVGVVGVTPDGNGLETTFADEEIRLCDTYDELLESIIALWMNDGPLSRCGIAGHYPVEISQAIQFDADKLYTEGVYLSMIQITYRDSIDEGEE